MRLTLPHSLCPHLPFPPYPASPPSLPPPSPPPHVCARHTQVGDYITLPEWFTAADWIGPQPEAGVRLRSERPPFFQFVHAKQDTAWHRDNNGADTVIKALAGVVLAACWSQAWQ